MKVVEINSGFRGSTGTIMLSIADLVHSYGEEAYTFSETKPGAAPIGHQFFGTKFENLFHRGVSVFSGISGKGSKRGTSQLLKSIDEIKPDILHLHNLHGWYINLPMLFDCIKKNNIRTVWTLHDCWGFTAQCSHFTMEKCEKWKTGCYDCPRYRLYPYTFVDRTDKMWQLKKDWFTGVKHMTIVTPSKWLCDLVKQSFLSEYNVKVINNGINLDIFKPTESDFREKYSLQDKKIVLGVAAGWNDRKGLDVFIELSKRLDGEKYQIVLVGTDDTVDNKLPKNIISIHRTQEQTELAEIYTASDLFVNPTREDTFPTVNMEAIACGTPVVTFRTGGSPEIIDDTCGSVVDFNDMDAFEKEIRRICEDKSYSKENCLNRARRYNMEDKFKEYFELFAEILQ